MESTYIPLEIIPPRNPEASGMTDITFEKRKSSSTFSYLSPAQSPRKVMLDPHNRILFHINAIQGLPVPSNQALWQPNPSILVSVINLEANETFSTDPKKFSDLVTWSENMPSLEIRNTSKVRFELRSQSLWKHKTLGSTDSVRISDLLEMQARAGHGRDKFIELNMSLKSSKAVLTVSIHEMAMEGQNAEITACDRQLYNEHWQKNSVAALRDFAAKLVDLRSMLNVDDILIACLLDIVLGVSVGVYEIINNPLAKFVGRNTLNFFQALSQAFAPWENISSRNLSKKSEEYTTALYEMCLSSVMAFEGVSRYLRMPDRRKGDLLDDKMTGWIRYFEACAKFLLVKHTERPRPPSPNHKRIRFHSHMVANRALPDTMIDPLTMDLPEIDPSAPYEKSDLLKLIAEWIFSPDSFQGRENQRISSEKVNGSGLRETIPVFHLGKHRKNPNVFCLSGPPGSGKTELLSRGTHWLAEMGCLGGYFTFDIDQNATHTSSPGDAKTKGKEPQGTKAPMNLNRLSMTFAHQLSTVVPSMMDVITDALSNTPGLVVKNGTMEEVFDRIFGNPLILFEELRKEREWNVPEPLLFVIDGIVGDEEENSETVSELVQLLSSNSISRLPQHVKFLVVCRSESRLGSLLDEKGVGYVYDMGSVTSSSTSSRSGDSAASISSGRSSNPRFSMQAF